MSKIFEQGEFAVSKAGHDKNHLYMIVNEDERYVYLVDGVNKTLEKPKKKQIKHLYALPFTISVSGKGGSGGKIADSDIRKALKAAKDAYEGAEPHPEKEECAFVQK